MDRQETDPDLEGLQTTTFNLLKAVDEAYRESDTDMGLAVVNAPSMNEADAGALADPDIAELESQFHQSACLLLQGNEPDEEDALSFVHVQKAIQQIIDRCGVRTTLVDIAIAQSESEGTLIERACLPHIEDIRTAIAKVVARTFVQRHHQGERRTMRRKIFRRAFESARGQILR